MNINIKIKLGILFFITSAYCNEIPMYPTPYFQQIDIICKELCNDLQVIHFNKQLHDDWVDYLFNKFLILNNSIINLINNTEETKSYLLEDIDYLFNALEKVSQSYLITYESYLADPFCRSLLSLLNQSKDKLKELFLFNQETIG